MWLWSTDVAAELYRRGQSKLAAQLESCIVACSYDGPALDTLRDPGLEVLAAILDR